MLRLKLWHKESRFHTGSPPYRTQNIFHSFHSPCSGRAFYCKHCIFQAASRPAAEALSCKGRDCCKPAGLGQSEDQPAALAKHLDPLEPSEPTARTGSGAGRSPRRGPGEGVPVPGARWGREERSQGPAGALTARSLTGLPGEPPVPSRSREPPPEQQETPPCPGRKMGTGCACAPRHGWAGSRPLRDSAGTAGGAREGYGHFWPVFVS